MGLPLENADGNADSPQYASAPDSTRNADYRSLSAVTSAMALMYSSR
jgi:hypothetical protein